MTIFSQDGNHTSQRQVDDDTSHAGTWYWVSQCRFRRGRRLRSPSPEIAVAVAHYENGYFELAEQEFRNQSASWMRNKRPRFASEHGAVLTRPMLEADAALCRARATGFMSDCMFALDANRRYVELLRTMASDYHCEDIVSQVLVATVSAMWLHLRTSQVDLARRVGLECIQWAADEMALSPSRVRTEKEALALLSTNLSSPKARLHMIYLEQALSVINLTSPQCSRRTHYLLPNLEDGHAHDRRRQAQKDLVCALSLHNRTDEICKRDSFLERAVSADFIPARRIQAIIHALDVLYLDTEHDNQGVAAKLDGLVSRASLSELNLLGCTLASCDLNRAVHTLDWCRRMAERNIRGGLGIDVESNLAECLLLNGEPSLAKFILLKWKRHQSGQNSDTAGVRFDLSPPSPPNKDASSWLWRTFIAASLEGDHAVSLALAEALYKQFRSNQAVIAYVFSLLQGKRPSVALDICRQHPQYCSDATYVAMRMYEVEAALFLESAPHSWCRLMEKTNLIAQSIEASPLQEALVLRASTANNEGLTKLMSGETELAIERIRTAMMAFETTISGGVAELRPHFNMCLLLWRMGQIDKAVAIWESVRCFNIKDDEPETVLQQVASTFRGCHAHAVTPWTASGKGGMDLNQVVLMDCLVLEAIVEGTCGQVANKLVDKLSSDRSRR